MLAGRVATVVLTTILGAALLGIRIQLQVPSQSVAVAGAMPPDSGAASATTTPSVAATPALFASGVVLASDDCSDPTTGVFPRMSQNSSWAAGCVDGAYQLESTVPVTFGGPTRLFYVFSRGSYADVDVAADVQIAAGGDSHTAVGLGCRYSGSGATLTGYRMYYFPTLVQWNLIRVDAGVSTPLTGRNAAFATNLPVMDSTHLELTCSGSTISVHVGGTSVYTIQDNSYQQGRVALTAGEETLVNPQDQIDHGYTGIPGARFGTIVLSQP